jgi:hypothetical protein
MTVPGHFHPERIIFIHLDDRPEKGHDRFIKKGSRVVLMLLLAKYKICKHYGPPKQHKLI